MKDHKIEGIHIISTKDFHYYISGLDSQMLDIDKLRTLLIGKGIIRFTDEGVTRYEVRNLQEAKLAGWNIIPHYANRHIAAVVQKEVPKNVESIWD